MEGRGKRGATHKQQVDWIPNEFGGRQRQTKVLMFARRDLFIFDQDS
jgi:hypothetical protein